MKRMNVVLVGFMGTGKTSVGRALAARLGRPFVDTDELVAARAGMAVPEIFARQGEEGFRRLEGEVIAEVAARPGQVIATGGGVLLREENRRRLRAGGILIRLNAAPSTIVARVGEEGLARRPLLAGAAGGDPLQCVCGLLAAREPYYREADATVDTDDRTVDEVAAAIAHLLSPSLPPAPTRSEDVRVDLGERGYDIVIGDGVLSVLGPRLAQAMGLKPSQRRRRALLVTHPLLDALYGDVARKSLASAGFQTLTALVPPGEETKSLAQAAGLYDCCVEAGLDRHSPIVALGGGVVGDLAGFVAATYLRGVPFVQVPTTLLAQVDASVGGKVAVNHPRAKNMIGAFHQPRLVVADVGTLRTLPEREFAGGLAEAIKHGVIADAGYFEFLERDRAAVLGLDPAALIRVVAGSCRIKAAVVEEDERESHRRMILNLGHTVGHAVEAATGYQRFLHGEAVAIGMAAAGRLALDPGVASGSGGGDGGGAGWTTAGQERLEALLAGLGLPVRIPGLPLAELARAMALDKKSRSGRIHWVLPRVLGRAEIRSGVPVAAVERILVELGALG